MAMALLSAKQSTNSEKFKEVGGACIVDKDNKKILGFGYNTICNDANQNNERNGSGLKI